MAIEIEQPRVELSNVAVPETQRKFTLCCGWKAYVENPYDEFTNTSGLIQMGLAENQASIIPFYVTYSHLNQINPLALLLIIYLTMFSNTWHVSFDLVEKYLEQHPKVSTWGKGAPGFRENALSKDYHGLKSFRTAMASFLQQIRGGRAKFDPHRVVLAAGATVSNKLLTFIFANPGDALLVLIFWDL